MEAPNGRMERKRLVIEIDRLQDYFNGEFLFQEGIIFDATTDVQKQDMILLLHAHVSVHILKILLLT